MKTAIYRSSCNRVLTRREPIRAEEGASGFRIVTVGIERIHYEVTADPAAVDGLARRAASNKNGKSKLGPFTVVITSARTEGAK